jgi:hypothetical protein
MTLREGGEEDAAPLQGGMVGFLESPVPSMQAWILWGPVKLGAWGPFNPHPGPHSTVGLSRRSLAGLICIWCIQLQFNAQSMSTVVVICWLTWMVYHVALGLACRYVFNCTKYEDLKRTLLLPSNHTIKIR